MDSNNVGVAAERTASGVVVISVAQAPPEMLQTAKISRI
jgi:hypothetical protein